LGGFNPNCSKVEKTPQRAKKNPGIRPRKKETKSFKEKAPKNPEITPGKKNHIGKERIPNLRKT